MRRSFGAVALGMLLLTACGDNGKEVTLSGYELSPPPSVAALSLPDASHDDASFDFVAPDGHLLLVYFGYMSCPDVCPTTLNEVRKALGQLGDAASRIDLAMTTIDPQRDTGENLTKYVQGFVAGAHALRTDDDDLLAAVAKGFGASYSVATNDAGEIEVSHSASLYAVDPTGTIVLTWPYGIEGPAMAADLKVLLGRIGR